MWIILWSVNWHVRNYTSCKPAFLWCSAAGKPTQFKNKQFRDPSRWKDIPPDLNTLYKIETEMVSCCGWSSLANRDSLAVLTLGSPLGFLKPQWISDEIAVQSPVYRKARVQPLNLHLGLENGVHTRKPNPGPSSKGLVAELMSQQLPLEYQFLHTDFCNHFFFTLRHDTFWPSAGTSFFQRSR